MNTSKVYVFDEVEGALFDHSGQKVSQKKLQELEKGNNVILIDDV